MGDRIKALVEIQKSARDMADAAERVAQIAKASDESGLAFAAFMLQASLLSYMKAVSAYMKKTSG